MNTMTAFGAPLPTGNSVAFAEPHVITALAQWLSEQIRKGAPKIALCQRLRDGSTQTVEDWDLHGDPLDTQAMADVIYGTALREANALRQSLAYVVGSMRPDGTGMLGRYTFNIEVPAHASWQSGIDVPVERSVVGMLMNHADALTRLSLGNAQSSLGNYQQLLRETTEHYARLLVQAQKRIDTLEKREFETLEIREKMHAYEMEKEAARRRDDNANEESKRRHDFRKYTLDKLDRIAPLILPPLARAVSKAGIDIPPPTLDPRGAPQPPAQAQERAAAEPLTPEAETFVLVQRLIQSFEPSQIGALAKLLRPDDQLPIFDRLYDLASTELAADAARAAAQQSREQHPPAGPAANPPSPPVSPPSPPRPDSEPT